MSDGPRLLHGRSQFGYTDRLEEALPEEPEAVSRAEQARMTAEAALTAHARRLNEWRQTRAVIDRELDLVRPLLPKELSSDLRVIDRQLERIERRLR